MVSLAVILFYYLALTLGQSLAERGLTPTIPAVWLPNVLLLAFGAVLLRQAASEPAGARSAPASLRQRFGGKRLERLRRRLRRPH